MAKKMKIIDSTTSESDAMELHLFDMGKRYPKASVEQILGLSKYDEVKIYLAYTGDLDNKVVNSWLKKNKFKRDPDAEDED